MDYKELIVLRKTNPEFVTDEMIEAVFESSLA